MSSGEESSTRVSVFWPAFSSDLELAGLSFAYGAYLVVIAHTPL